MHKSVSRNTTFFLLAALFVCSYGVAQDHPNLQRGYAPGKTMGLEGPDDINLFNGNLSLKIPLGQSYPITESFSYSFALRYNSNVWDFVRQIDSDCTPNNTPDWPYSCEVFTHPFPTGFSNAGLGWTLSLGQLLPDEGQFGQYNPSTQWVYVSPDGGKHAFYNKLHIDDLDQDPPTARYTRDGSYLRLISLGTAPSGRESYSVEFPDGMIHKFENFEHVNFVDASPTTWRLVEIADRFGNYLEIDYLFVCNGLGECSEEWTVTDSVGRTHFILFKEQGNTGRGVTLVEGSDWELEEVTLATAHDGNACYKFRYSEHTIPRSGKCDDSHFPDQANIRVLDKIIYPDSPSSISCDPGLCEDCSTAEFEYNVEVDDLGFVCTHTQLHLSDKPGTLAQMRLPTGGLITWDYQDYKYPVGETYCSVPTNHHSWYTAISTSLGVQTRARTGSVLDNGTWQYNHQDPTSSTDTDVLTEVIIPGPGHKTVHFFNTDVERCPSTGRGWDYGLPYTPESSNGELFLAKKYYEKTGPNSFNLKRSTFVRYEHDALPPDTVPYGETSSAKTWYDTNRRLAETKTVIYGDDFPAGDAFEHTEYGSFDGLGHYL